MSHSLCTVYLMELMVYKVVPFVFFYFNLDEFSPILVLFSRLYKQTKKLLSLVLYVSDQRLIRQICLARMIIAISGIALVVVIISLLLNNVADLENLRVENIINTSFPFIFYHIKVVDFKHKSFSIAHVHFVSVQIFVFVVTVVIISHFHPVLVFPVQFHASKQFLLRREQYQLILNFESRVRAVK